MTEINNQNKNVRTKNRSNYTISEKSNKPIKQIIKEYKTDLLGLTENEASIRLVNKGKNEVSYEKAPPGWKQLLISFKNPFIFVLIILAIVNFFTDYFIPENQHRQTDLTGVIIIATMIIVSGLLRFWQEYRTNKAAESLKLLVRTTTTVFRKNEKTGQSFYKEIPIKHIVPGDIVLLSAGDMVPADIILIESKNLFISQAILTGESISVEKYISSENIHIKNNINTSKIKTKLFEIPNSCFMGTSVTSGTAKGIVIATGTDTYLGTIAKTTTGSRAETAFDRGVNSVSWLLIRFMLIMVPVVLLINGFTKGDWFEATLFSLAIAVGLTPEMLPMIVSSNLAKGAIAMSKHKVIVKRLNAIQNFGAMDILCTDKTGTLTEDNIILNHYLDNDEKENYKVLQLAWLNSCYQSGTKNLMDKAIIHRGSNDINTKKLIAYQKIDEIPFDFVRRKISVTVKTPKKRILLICKGAAEEMLSVCNNYRLNKKTLSLDENMKIKITKIVNNFNKQGLRVLLLATRQLNKSETNSPLSCKSEQQLELQGMLTFLDPAKDSAIHAISALNENGITVKVLTGDNEIVTKKICADVGLNVNKIINGFEIECMSDLELSQKVENLSAFCKLTPLQKSRILQLLQNNGHTVGFLGDGINDALALQNADVGISVDTGTDIAKESADIILLEKDLMVLEQGVIKGRETFGNIIKYLNITASSNFGNVLSVLIASAFIPFMPMLAIQLLVQNLLYDISQLALPWDTIDEEFLKSPRKWDSKNISRFMIWIGPISSIFDITTFALMWYIFQANNINCSSLFQSGWFIEGLLSQTLVVHMLRTQKIPFIQSTAAIPVMLTTVAVIALGLYIPFSDFGKIIGLQPLPITYFPWLILTLISYCIIIQLIKQFYTKRFGTWL
ncbi:Magnesium-transporting ATPase, P-type 1 [Candidatus Providencia siddallii]|uniref:Magnesium-transporting ATPase, P-type 1 n=1 Tax=Candidatus Providencia siddallii TaxID=1715285 RepID=A0A0M6W8H2_9GAMM|nr:Magnesium-transporting ATPase, P-type 1 [Candidatus Providencia siddallii]